MKVFNFRSVVNETTRKAENTIAQIEKVKTIGVSPAKRIMTFFLMVFMFTSIFAQDVANDIEELFEDQIKPITNVIVMIAVFLAAVYAAVLFFQGKKEGLKIVGMIIAGALVLKFMVYIVEGILEG